MKKCYIAGKIGDLPKEVYEPKFEGAEDAVRFLNYDPINPVKLHDNCDHGKYWLAYMKCDIAALMTCEALYTLNNWQDSPGATIEVNLAKSLGLKIYYEATPVY